MWSFNCCSNTSGSIMLYVFFNMCSRACVFSTVKGFCFDFFFFIKSCNNTTYSSCTTRCVKIKILLLFNIFNLWYITDSVKSYFTLESRRDALPGVSQTVLNFEGPKHFMFSHLHECTAESKWSKSVTITPQTWAAFLSLNRAVAWLGSSAPPLSSHPSLYRLPTCTSDLRWRSPIRVPAHKPSWHRSTLESCLVSVHWNYPQWTRYWG